MQENLKEHKHAPYDKHNWVVQHSLYLFMMSFQTGSLGVCICYHLIYTSPFSPSFPKWLKSLSCWCSGNNWLSWLVCAALALRDYENPILPGTYEASLHHFMPNNTATLLIDLSVGWGIWQTLWFEVKPRCCSHVYQNADLRYLLLEFAAIIWNNRETNPTCTWPVSFCMKNCRKIVLTEIENILRIPSQLQFRLYIGF